jgi:hypothetical protein
MVAYTCHPKSKIVVQAGLGKQEDYSKIAKAKGAGSSSTRSALQAQSPDFKHQYAPYLNLCGHSYRLMDA